MRGFLMMAPVVLLVAGCNAGDRDAVGNAAENAGEAIGNGVADAIDATENKVEDIGNAVSDRTATRDDWVGRWTGVEGTYLVISKGATPGTYKLEMQYTLDDKGNFDGKATDAGIAFTRPDGAQTLTASTGEATGLKWLADKQNCLKVKDGEGYCRD